MNQQDRLIFNLFILQYYFSEISEAMGNKRKYYDFIDEYGYESFLTMPNVRAIMSCFPENEVCRNRDEKVFGKGCNYNYIKEA